MTITARALPVALTPQGPSENKSAIVASHRRAISGRCSSSKSSTYGKYACGFDDSGPAKSDPTLRPKSLIYCWTGPQPTVEPPAAASSGEKRPRSRVDATLTAVGKAVLRLPTTPAEDLYRFDGKVVAHRTAPLDPNQRVCRSVNRWLLGRVADRIEVEGDLPEGGAVLAANHPSWTDGPIAYGFPGDGVRAVAAEQRGIVGACVHWSDALMVGSGNVIDTAADFVARGGTLWIAPAGGNHVEPLKTDPEGPGVRAHRGGAVIAMKANKPLVPMAFDSHGSRQAWKNFCASAGQAAATAVGGAACVALAACGERAAAAAVAGAAVSVGVLAHRRRRPATVHIKLGSPLPLEKPADDSEEAFRAATQRNTSKMASAINSLQAQMDQRAAARALASGDGHRHGAEACFDSTQDPTAVRTLRP